MMGLPPGKKLLNLSHIVKHSVTQHSVGLFSTIFFRGYTEYSRPTFARKSPVEWGDFSKESILGACLDRE